MSVFVVFLLSSEEKAPLGTVFTFLVHSHPLRRQHFHKVVWRCQRHPLVGCCPGMQSDSVEGQEGIWSPSLSAYKVRREPLG